jgi:hypothetical protein
VACVDGVLGGDDAIAGALQVQAQKAPHVAVVLDHQNLRRLPRRPRALAACDQPFHQRSSTYVPGASVSRG